VQLIQQRQESITCDVERFPDIEFKGKCWNWNYKTIKEYVNGETTYTRIEDENPIPIRGAWDIYDNSGFIAELRISSPNQFYEDINPLISSKWIDEYTISVIANINFYNINNGQFFNMRILYENMYNFYSTSLHFNLLNINPKPDPYIYTTILFSLFLLCFTFFALKEKPKIIIIKNKKKVNAAMQMLGVFMKIFNYILDNFRKPDFFELVSN
jgi:hypothetical protein